MSAPLLRLELRLEHDIVHARQRARQLAGLLGFEAQDQTRIATAVSEMARNAFTYGQGGKVDFSISDDASMLLVRIEDNGPGIENLQAVLDGQYTSATGMGLGIIGTRRLMDAFEIESSAEQGTRVTFGKQLPKRAPGLVLDLIGRVAAELADQRPVTALEEIQQQNQELLRTLDLVRTQQAELAQTNRELEETNRGVVALYAEIDGRADYLQRANDVKTRFLSNMTHEFRTPLNSILNLTRILIDRMDGELTAEQEKQVRYIARSAEDLSEIVNDLLDLAKVEAGKIQVKPSEFQVSDLFAALRGMLRPLVAQNSSVSLIVEESELPPLFTDESKVSQILRNFISNALKYTERGEVRVSAKAGPENTIVFAVTDTGIGVAPEDRERIFEEYTQLESPLQKKTKGTGLGLPLARRLAALLGGSVRVSSQVGVGSTFSAIIPRHYSGDEKESLVPEVNRTLDPARAPVLVVEDNRETLFAYEKYLTGTNYQVLPARTIKEARDWLRAVQPVAIVMDVLLESESSWALLGELRRLDKTRKLPILVCTMVDNEARARMLGADRFRLKPVDRDWLITTLDQLTRERPQEVLLVVDDDEVSRYLLRTSLAETQLRIVEASTGLEGLQHARALKPRAIILDLAMPGMDGFTVLQELRAEPELHDVPVIIYTARMLSEHDRARLGSAAAILPKESSAREATQAKLRGALAAAGLEDVMHG